MAATLEQMMRDKEEREPVLGAIANEIRARLDRPRADYVTSEEAFAAARARLQAARKTYTGSGAVEHARFGVRST